MHTLGQKILRNTSTTSTLPSRIRQLFWFLYFLRLLHTMCARFVFALIMLNLFARALQYICLLITDLVAYFFILFLLLYRRTTEHREESSWTYGRGRGVAGGWGWRLWEIHHEEITGRRVKRTSFSVDLFQSSSVSDPWRCVGRRFPWGRRRGDMGEQVERMVPWERRMGQRGWEARDCEGGAGWRRDGGHQSPIAAWDRTRRHWGPDLSFFARGARTFQI